MFWGDLRIMEKIKRIKKRKYLRAIIAPSVMVIGIGLGILIFGRSIGLFIGVFIGWVVSAIIIFKENSRGIKK